MSEIEGWISTAALTLGIDIERLDEIASRQVRTLLESKFVTGEPRVWWLGLKTPYVYYEIGSTRLSEILPVSQGRVLFIPEVDDGHPLPVYAVDVATLEGILGECPFFEYYVADRSGAWLVAETEHDVFILCGTTESLLRLPAGGRLWPAS
ncbi:hypothetical protein HDF16_005708 [Granulicella aggregans]|uniref:Uncharacterized protein n=1 Tax=Granulicella aggregans TaxID=474949 RepID=A0A7W7ZJK7_9BACT|nr:hypothetical protein [Granulicella aggregans]MBB5060972.1 hypothetical protein [Granulicella aggregans]